jgi:hypothetical protein
MDRLESSVRALRDHGLQMPLFSLGGHPQVHDAPSDEGLPRDAVSRARSSVHVEDQPAFGVIDQYGVVDELVEVAVFYFRLQCIPRPRRNL